MKSFEPKQVHSTATSMQEARDLSDEAGYAAEYERLEARLFGGMNSIVEVPFTHQPDRIAPEASRGPILSSAEVAQREAEKRGDIVKVPEIAIDISESFGGADIDARSVLTAGHANDEGSKASYYFPDDPDMPAWRPFFMGWPWISILVTIALLLAGVQEYLCQLSMKRQSEGEGLAKFKNPKELSVLVYFTWKYAPVLFFVIYGIMWQATDFEVKRLEPFYQLSKKSGATAGESLNMDYLTFMSWLVPLRALRHKQYAVIYVSLSTLVASSLVPVLQSASVNVYPPRHEREADKLKFILIDPPWSRAVTACLVFVAISGCILIYEMRRKSGLLSDPKGIAGIAAMATRSHILNEFRGLDTAPLDKIHKQLRHRRYILHKSSLWQGEYIRNNREKIYEHGTDPRPLMLRLRAGLPYIGFIICFTISIPIFMFVEGANKVTEKLPFLLTSLATLIKLLWNTMNCDVRMLEPFHILSRRNAPAKTLTLDYTGTNPILLPVQALINKHYLVSVVAMGSILTEVLTVCVSSFSVDGKRFIPGQDDTPHKDESNSRANTDETFRSFWISFSLVIGILITLVIIASIVYVRRSHRFMPRQIGTMAAVLAFIHQSRMLVNFIDTWNLDSAQMTRHLEKQGKKYGLGWFVGRDNEDHCGIDEEPLWASYEYGKNSAEGRLRENEIGSWQYYDG
jgi:hypothetical protein